MNTKIFKGECSESVDGTFVSDRRTINEQGQEVKKKETVHVWKLSVCTDEEHVQVFHIPFTHPEHDRLATANLQGKMIEVEAISSQGAWDPVERKYFIKWKYNRLINPKIGQTEIK